MDLDRAAQLRDRAKVIIITIIITSIALLDSMVASFVLKFPFGVVWY